MKQTSTEYILHRRDEIYSYWQGKTYAYNIHRKILTKIFQELVTSLFCLNTF